jgi:hypothetical protein
MIEAIYLCHKFNDGIDLCELSQARRPTSSGVFSCVFIVVKIKLLDKSRVDVFLQIITTINSMKKARGRPRKEQGERKDLDLRIPVTPDQKARVMEAVTLEGADMAAWARPILLRAAEQVLRKNGERGDRTRRA